MESILEIHPETKPTQSFELLLHDPQQVSLRIEDRGPAVSRSDGPSTDHRKGGNQDERPYRADHAGAGDEPDLRDPAGNRRRGPVRAEGLGDDGRSRPREGPVHRERRVGTASAPPRGSDHCQIELRAERDIVHRGPSAVAERLTEHSLRQAVEAREDRAIREPNAHALAPLPKLLVPASQPHDDGILRSGVVRVQGPGAREIRPGPQRCRFVRCRHEVDLDPPERVAGHESGTRLWDETPAHADEGGCTLLPAGCP